MPWNNEIEVSTLSRANVDGSATDTPLKIGIYWTDGVVTPQPPIQRGLRIVRDLMSHLGHKVVDWEPPSQTTAKKIHLAFLKADGAHDVHQQLGLSGEPLVPPLRKSFQLRDPMPLLEYQDLTIQGKAYNEAYYDYWNSSSKDDGQVVDVALMPVAPHAAVIPEKFYHTDNPETYDGAPVGLQIVARKWEEEKVWAIAKILDNALRNRKEQVSP
ncbi:MAG: hypothetical protein Q9174_001841 [Haloplaca sp. 1 TL-2023]